MVKFTSDGPVFFFQERYGLGRRRFWICKFRTMQADAEARLKELEALNEASGAAFKIRADPRITRVGAFLRRTSLDELPQLLNVLKGEMSLVGPRPMSVRDVSLFSEAWLMAPFQRETRHHGPVAGKRPVQQPRSNAGWNSISTT